MQIGVRQHRSRDAALQVWQNFLTSVAGIFWHTHSIDLIFQSGSSME